MSTMDAEGLHEEILKLTRIGIALTRMHDLGKLLEMIVREARALTGADAGSLYLREGDQLRFVVSQNDTLKRRLGPERERALFHSFSLPLDEKSIAGYVATTKRNLNLLDVSAIPSNAPYVFNPDFDQRNEYHTVSMLVVPLLDHCDQVLGVLQLINATEEGRVVPFSRRWEDLLRSVASQAAVAVSNARLTAEIKRVHLDTIYRLSVAAEYRDHDTANHIRRMSHYAAALARRLGWDDHRVETVLYSSPMHDIGKIGIPDSILLKPGRLTPEERTVMQTHAEIGARILRGSDSEILKLSEVVARSHHEKWDGSGYPRGLSGTEIPEAGRIVAVVDVFDALSSKRVYKGAVGMEEALAIIQQDAGKHFDPDYAAAFSGILGEVQEIAEFFRDTDAPVTPAPVSIPGPDA